jgi:hypothetical protein
MAGYLGSTPVPSGIKETQSFTATAGQTTFNTLGYSNGNNISVFLNGVRLINGTDYTATNGSDIVLTAAASASDVLDFETFNEFNLVNQNLTTPTFTDTVVVSGDTTASLTLKNNTHEDTDGGRESTLIFQGEQSGGEISTLAEIQASHDGTSDDQKGDLIFKTNDGSDNNAPTERARIDSSGNLLVGKTVTTFGTEGHVISSTFANFTRDGNAPLNANRTTSDGDIVGFYKDSSQVGSIGTRAGRIKIGDGDVGLFFDNSNNRINPEGPSDTSANDNAIDLGGATQRFKDLYLSGGVYVGGTTSANRLTDFETGTFVPTLSCDSNGSLVLDTSSDTCAYVKIGALVCCQGSVAFNGSGATGNFRLASFPFGMHTGLAEQAELSAASINLYTTAQNVNGIVNGEMSNVSGDATLLIRDGGGTTSGVAAMANHFGASTTLRFSVHYRTDE